MSNSSAQFALNSATNDSSINDSTNNDSTNNDSTNNDSTNNDSAIDTSGTSPELLSQLRHRIDQLLDQWSCLTNQQRRQEQQAVNARLAESELTDAGTSLDQYVSKWLTPLVLSASCNSDPLNLSNMASVPLDWCAEFSRLSTWLNQNVVSAKSAGSFGECEAWVLRTLYATVYGSACPATSAPGVITSGGSLANLSALWLARNSSQLPAESVIVGSQLMHYSIAKAADILGLGRHAVRLARVDKNYRCDLESLKEVVAECQSSGKKVLAVVGVAGTTEIGSIDPLREMGQFAKSIGSWFHVDATWVGGGLFSNAYRQRLVGIELADSLALDCHKQMHLPIAQALVLVKDPQKLAAIRHSADYLFHHDNDRGLHAIDGSRAASVLLLHAALHLLGREGYARIADGTLSTAQKFAVRIAATEGMQLLAPPQSNIVAYRFRPADCQGSEEVLNELNEYIYHRQVNEGRGRVSLSRVELSRAESESESGTGQSTILRAVFSNPQTTVEDAWGVLEEQMRYRNAWPASSAERSQ